MSQSVAEHRESAPKSVGCVVITVSDTRTIETDTSGRIMRERLEAAGHRIVGYHIVPDEPEQIDGLIDRYSNTRECQAILFNGGTGIATLWARYEFFIDGERSHCGRVLFQLYRLDGAWKVMNFADTHSAAHC